LNATVDAQVYFKINDDEESVKSSIYNVNNYQRQIVNLARTTLRNIIGILTLKSANSERGRINNDLHKTLKEETFHWGIEIENALKKKFRFWIIGDRRKVDLIMAGWDRSYTVLNIMLIKSYL
jgi:regulator of protease activity HflC (stomatin/prohibitin superfamily)